MNTDWEKTSHFVTPELQVLFELLKANGEITAYDLAELDESVQRAWYRVLEENYQTKLAPMN